MGRIVGAISLVIFFGEVVRLGSRLQCELGDWESKSEIYDIMSGVKSLKCEVHEDY